MNLQALIFGSPIDTAISDTSNRDVRYAVVTSVSRSSFAADHISCTYVTVDNGIPSAELQCPDGTHDAVVEFMSNGMDEIICDMDVYGEFLELK